MRFFVLGLFLFFSTACRDNFRASVLELGLGFSAQSACSCLWVVGQSEDYCRDYAKLTRVKTSVDFDYQNKIATSRALFLFRQKAKFIDSERGCKLL
jgi:hypothetical protein